MRFMVKSILLMSVITLLVGCATGTSVVQKGEVYKGMSKDNLRDVLFKAYPGDDPFLSGSFTEYNSNNKIEIVSGSSKNVFYIFENTNQPVKCGMFLCDYGNGILKSWHYSLADARLLPKKQIQKKQPKISISSNSNSDLNYIDELNKLIKDLENGNINEEEFNIKKSEILK